MKRDLDDVRQLPATGDASKRAMDNEGNRTTALHQQPLQMMETLPCPYGYKLWRGICYKAFDISNIFSDATSACRQDGGTLAMPRDAETNDYLVTLMRYKTTYLFGLHDRREEGSYEWVDGSALGAYSSWAPGEPNNHGDGEDCVITHPVFTDKWNDAPCDHPYRFICQTVPGTSCSRIIS
ncbi:C-type lectin BML-2-like [Branchiostoma floridae x Branchiostoma japonicum]